MDLGTRRKVGLSIAISGIGIAAINLVPAVFYWSAVPWLLIIGSLVYVPGALLYSMNAKGMDRKQITLRLGLIRLGFVAVLVVYATLMLNSSPPQ